MPEIPERCRSGLTGTPGKRVYCKTVPGVRIPLSPQEKGVGHGKFIITKNSPVEVKLSEEKSSLKYGRIYLFEGEKYYLGTGGFSQRDPLGRIPLSPQREKFL
jgi:hypothetical protein